MTDEQSIETAALVAERTRLKLLLAAIDKVLELRRVSSSLGPANPQGQAGLGSPLTRTRDRRSKLEIQAIKDAALSEALSEPGTKHEIFDRLLAAGVVTNTRRDSELILRTLKQHVDDGRLTPVNGRYLAADSLRQQTSVIDLRSESHQEVPW